MRAQRSSGRRGTALVSVLLVTTALVSVSLAFFGLGLGSSRQFGGAVDDRRAFHLAEAAIGEAMTAIRAGATGNVGNFTTSTPAALGGGVFWVEATDLGNDTTRLEATALVGSGRAALDVTVQDAGKPPLFPGVLNSDDDLTLASGVVIDSFDSTAGSYASQVVNTSPIGVPYANDQGDVGSNGDIILNAGAHVMGDVTPGVGETVSLANNAYVSGSTAPATQPFYFSSTKLPNIPMGAPLAVASTSPQTIGPGQLGYGSLSIGKDAKLTVTGPADILVTDFTGGKDATLIIDATNGPVTFYVANSYTHLNGFEAVPAPNSPMAVAFLINGSSPITFPSYSNIRGAYYAPDAVITFTSGNEAWGSFAGEQVSMSASTKFHFDEVLTQYWDADTGPGSQDTMEILSWGPGDVDPALRNDRRDPFALLKLNPQNLPAPHLAWDI